MECSKKVLISGAGLVGSLLAIAMKQRGHDVELYELRSDIRKDQSLIGKSINLIITAKGINPIINLGLWKTVKSIVTPVTGRMIHSKDANLTYQPYGKDETECNYSVSRAELNKLLMTEAEKSGVIIHFETGLKGLDLESKNAYFLNGTDKKYDLFLGTDGAGSPTREAILSELGPLASFNIEPLGSHYKELSMPSDNSGNYQMEKTALHIWPRGNHMLMALPNQDGSFTMTLYMPEKWYEDFNSPEKVSQYFLDNYADSIPLMPNYLEEYYKNPQGFLGCIRMSPWVYKDQVVLLGDAAHAIVPFFGQGMNCGFSDVQYLLDQLDLNSDDLHSSLNNYNKHQKLNGDAIADLSIENFTEMCEKVGDTEFLFKKRVEHIIEKTYPDIYRSRYGMVTYTLIPYHMAKEAGEIQSEILEELCKDLKNAEDVDLAKAKELIEGKFSPWLQENKLSIERFRG
ncbi:MAG: FAD-dependent monooxygenase [Bacteriovoracaceae bacterium]|jgi:kynurenine 3-monooxygenase|nr:FAD-dependent monooxygenase [Bacteriovoracaceae bacterium]